MPSKRSSSAKRKAPVEAVPAVVAPLAPAPPAEIPSVALPYPVGGWRAAAYASALVLPPLGLGLALLYWKGPDARSRRFSRWCLALALAGLVAGWLGSAFWTGLQNNEGGVQPW